MVTIFYVIIGIIVLWAILFFVPTKRKREIKEILADLKSLGLGSQYDEAIKHNITFFKLSRSLWGYFYWLVSQMPKLRRQREKLLELADLPLPKWQKETHLSLIRLEKLSFPGLLKMVKEAIIKEIHSLAKTKKEPLVLLGIGSGGMELERQTLQELLVNNFSHPLVFLCVELSPAILEIGLSNIQEFLSDKIIVRQLTALDGDLLLELKKEATRENKVVVTILNTDIFNLKETLPSRLIDVIYHSRVRHHLTPTEAESLEQLAMSLASKVIEFDDFYNIPSFIFPTIITWRPAVTLNGAILSYVRDLSKKEILSQQKPGWELKFNNALGYYLKVYDGSPSKT